MTKKPNPIAALIAGVQRRSLLFNEDDQQYYMAAKPNGDYVLYADVLAALEAATPPDLKMEQALHWLDYAEIEFAEAGIAAEVIRAQAAQIAGMKATNDAGALLLLSTQQECNAAYARAEAAEAKVAELEAQVVAEKEENRWAYIQAAMDDKQTDAETEAATLRVLE